MRQTTARTRSACAIATCLVAGALGPAADVSAAEVASYSTTGNSTLREGPGNNFDTVDLVVQVEDDRAISIDIDAGNREVVEDFYFILRRRIARWEDITFRWEMPGLNVATASTVEDWQEDFYYANSSNPPTVTLDTDGSTIFEVTLSDLPPDNTSLYISTYWPDFNAPGQDFTLVIDPNGIDAALAEVPIPGAAWLFASGIAGLVGLRRRRRSEGANA